MLIRCWGARGSIPVSGSEYLKYGGDTTCIEVRARSGETVILDAGTGIRRLGKRLLAEGRSRIHILFTHAHWDHLLGFPFFRPLYEDGPSISVFGCPCAQLSVQEMISQTMAPPNFPVPLENVRADMSYHTECREPISLGSLTISPTRLSHPNEGLGYKLTEAGRCFVFLTDNELDFQHPGGGTFDDYVAFCSGADLLIHDAEFTGAEYRKTRGWGHSRFADAIDLAVRANVRALGLFHHNQDRTDEDLDDIVRTCRAAITDRGVPLVCFAVTQGTERRL